jgi:uncharacterized damage-inducible protein DinB
MNAKSLSAFCALVLSASSLSAQSDPISGKWGRDGVTFLELKLDNAGAVTGQVMNERPNNVALIKSGSFHRQSGVLKLEGEAKDDAGALNPFTIDGNLVGDSLRVTAKFGNYTGSMAFVRLASETPSAQPVTSETPSAIIEELRKSFDTVHEAVARSAEMVPANKYTYKPVATVRTFGELVAHVADSYLYYCTYASGRKVEWSDAIEKGKTDKATITQKLKESREACTAAYANNASRVGGLINNVAHTNLHYGNVITYLRMMGLVPPSS